MGILTVLAWFGFCIGIAGALYCALVAAGRHDDLLDDFADRLERGDDFSLPPAFHSTGDKA
jgi:uncharacterized membrane protein